MSQQHFRHCVLAVAGAMVKRPAAGVHNFLDAFQSYAFVRIETKIKQDAQHFRQIVLSGQIKKSAASFNAALQPACGVLGAKPIRVAANDGAASGQFGASRSENRR
jgi:hypothetical protein